MDSRPLTMEPGNGSARTDAEGPGRFELTAGPPPFDPRITPVRGDVAALALAGVVFAPHYVEPRPMRCGAMKTMIRGEASFLSVAVSELLPGEDFALVDVAGDWAWGYSVHDGYCGYVPAAILTEAEAPGAASHIVHGGAALAFGEPSIKSPVVVRLPAGSRLVVRGTSEDGKFLDTEFGFVSVRHARPIDTVASDPVGEAEALAGVPYLWGGRSGDGLDCSGLLQLVYALCGMTAPRDSDQQMERLGRFLGEGEALRRGDMVFFPGHVGIMADEDRLVHANAHWMKVVTEPLADVIARFPADGPAPVLARKRLD